MKKRPDLQQLQLVARACLDRDLSVVKAAADRREALLNRLKDLEPTAPAGLDPVTAARIGAIHQIWADARRAEINVALARSTADWLERQAEARQSFGRWQVLCKLASRSRISR